MNRVPANSFHSQHGVGLIEILIAVVILSVGLLGIAWVQTRALSNNNSSMARSMAVVASYSILDAMRADRANAANGDYDVEVAADDCPGVGTTLADAQISNWCGELGTALGLADTTIGEIDCNGTGTCTITITFDDSRVGAGISTGTAQTVVTKAML